MRPPVLLALAVLLYGAAGWCAPDGAGSPSAAIRALARPFALPLVWRSLAAAEAARTGDPERAAAQSRLLMSLLPEWSDGHIHFAFRLAGAAGSAAPDRLLMALDWLQRARPGCPQREHELLAAMAFLVEMRIGQSAAEHALRRRVGTGAAELARDWLAEAHRLSPSRARYEHALFARAGVIASALRTGDTGRAAGAAEELLRGLPQVRDSALRQQWQSALEALLSELSAGRKNWTELRRRHPVLRRVLPH